MNWVQVSHHMDYLLEKIQNNQCEDELMKMIHCYAGYLLGDRNYIEEVKQKRMTKFGLLCKIKDDILEQSRGPGLVPALGPAPVPAPGPGPVPAQVVGNNNNPIVHVCANLTKVVQDFMEDLCKIVYKQ